MSEVPDERGSGLVIAHPLQRSVAQPLGDEPAEDAEHVMSLVFRQVGPEAGQMRLGVVGLGGRRFRGVRDMADPSGDKPGVAEASPPGSAER